MPFILVYTLYIWNTKKYCDYNAEKIRCDFVDWLLNIFTVFFFSSSSQLKTLLKK